MGRATSPGYLLRGQVPSEIRRNAAPHSWGQLIWGLCRLDGKEGRWFRRVSDRALM